MKRKELLLRYAAHSDAIEVIGKYPLSESLQITNLGDTNEMKATVQRCYKEIKKDGLKDITIIEYLCWISTLYILDSAQRDLQSHRALRASTHRYTEYIIRNYKSFGFDAKNLLRLVTKKPSYYFNWIHEDENKPDDKPVMVMEAKEYGREIDGKFLSVTYHGMDVESYMLLSGFWFLLCQKELYNEQEGELLLEAYIRFGFLKGIIEDDETKYESEIPQKYDKLAAG